MYKALKMPPNYEDRSSITMTYLEVESQNIVVKDPVERVLRGNDIYGDAEAHEIVKFLDVPMILTG